MFIDFLIERLGEAGAIATAGAVLGLLFGAAAQRSRLCLRAAVADTLAGARDAGLAVWLFASAAAVVLTQGFVLAGWLDTGTARSLASRGSISGALAGGALFGIGMVMSRGGAGRLMVLGAQGQSQALLAALVFAASAAAALAGPLQALRMAISELWTIEGGSARDLLAATGLGPAGAVLLGLGLLAAAMWLARRARLASTRALAGLAVGAAVALGWLSTWAVAHRAFDVLPVQSLSISGPSADWLLALSAWPGVWTFNLAFLPALLAGAFIAAVGAGEWKPQGWRPARWPRELGGAALMGFGGMLAGGCSIGAGLSGMAVFALTAWAALAAMWLTAAAGLAWFERPGRSPITA